jgi:hypothetical protein
MDDAGWNRSNQDFLSLSAFWSMLKANRVAIPAINLAACLA